MISKLMKRYSSSAVSSVTPSQTQLLINGKFVNSVSGKTFDTFDPYTEKKIASVAEADVKDVNLAVAAAKKAMNGPWSKIPAE